MADDVSIVIAAQDQASEVLKSIGKNTEKLAQTMGKASEQTNRTQKTFDFAIKGFIALKAATMAAQAAMAGITAAFKGMEASVAAFNTQEEAARGMTQAQLDYAASLQIATNVGDETTLALLRQAEAMGASKDTSDELVTAAVGLAEAFGINQAEALKKVMQATNGNANALQELIPGIRTATTEEEKLALITQAASTGLQKLQADADTTKGAMERSAGAFGDLSEKIGALFAPIYKVVHTGLAVFAETLQSALGPAIDLVNNGFEGLQPYIDAFMEAMQATAVVVGTTVEAMISMLASLSNYFTESFGRGEYTSEMLTRTIDNMATYVIKALTMMEVAWVEFPTVIQLAIDSAALTLTQFANNIAHIFTVIIPQYMTWFKDNFFNLIRDALVSSWTALKNFGRNIGEFWGTIMGWISSGMEGGFDGLIEKLGNGIYAGLTDGFEASTKELPKMALRTATDTEKLLARNVGESALKLADEYDRKVRDRTDRLKESMNLKLRVDAPELKGLGQLGQADPEAVNTIKDSMEKVEKSVQQGTAVSGRLLTRGSGDVVQARIMEYTRQSAIVLDQMSKRMAREMGLEVGNVINKKPLADPMNIQVIAGSV